jgi:hypothetical protein
VEAAPVGRFHLADVFFNFHSNSGVFDDLADFYRPYYALERGWYPTPSLSVHAVLKGARRSGPPIIDVSQYLQPPSRVFDDGFTSVFERSRLPIEIVLDRAQRSITVHAAHPIELHLQTRLLLRDQLFQRIEARRGRVMLHGSAVEKGGRVVAFMGPRNSGKTTGLLALVIRRGFNFVSADRIGLCLEQSGDVELAGVPGRCNIPLVAFAAGAPAAPLREEIALSAAIRGKVLVDAERLARLGKTGVTPKGQLSTIVFPHVGAHEKTLRVRTVRDRERIHRHLIDNCLEGADQNKHVHWLHYFPEDSVATAGRRAAMTALADAIADQVRVLEVSGSYADYAAWLDHGGAEEGKNA